MHYREQKASMKFLSRQVENSIGSIHIHWKDIITISITKRICIDDSSKDLPIRNWLAVAVDWICAGFWCRNYSRNCPDYLRV